MSKEAMKLALEALEKADMHCPVNTEAEVFVRLSITALREALANEALDKMAENARELGLDYEPVWNNLPSNKDVEDAMRLKRLSRLAEQPAQRPWQGLTDQEIEQGCKESWVTEQAWQSAVWWAEARLKEKNT